MRIIAILAAYNEERFIAGCIEHYARQGVDVYLIDHGSTDQTVTIAERYWHKGLIGLEHFPRNEFYEWKFILERKEELAATLEADWFIHADPDEIRLAPASGTLAEAFEAVDQQGYNAVNFIEFTFIPVQEAPDHNHPDFQKTMRWYYPFLPSFPHRLNAWKRQPQSVELAWSAGHQVRFLGLRMYPESFPMRHYQFLSVAHALAKYAHRNYPPAERQIGWHGWRVNVRPDGRFQLPPQADLREYIPDRELDASQPRQRHYLADIVQAQPESQLPGDSGIEATHALTDISVGRERRPEILVIVNRPHWAHDYKTRNLQQQLGSDYHLVKRYHSEFVQITAADLDRADLIQVYFWMQFEQLQHLEAAFKRNAHKLVLGICSHFELEGPRREPGLAVLRKAQAVFVHNPFLYYEFVSLLDLPVFYTPNGVDTEFFRPAESPRPPSPLRVGWAGSLTNQGAKQRGFYDLIVPAVSAVEGVELVTAVREDQWRSHAEMLDFYQSLDVYLCASRNDGTPNPCLEAAACGVPLVTTRVGNMPELIQHGVNGFFVEPEVADIQAKLTLLRDNADLRLQMSENIRQSIQVWDWAYQADNFRQMYQFILKRQPSKSPEAPQVICILGLHRSGTSRLTRLVNLLGVDLGPANESLVRAEDHLTEFGEPKEIVEINDQLLARLGGSWDRPPKFPPGWERDPLLADLRHQAQSLLKRFTGLELWGWQDPRTCLTLPFWQALITQPISYLLCLQSPVDAAASLGQQPGFTFEKSVELWATYMGSAIEQTAAQPRYFVFYEDVLGDDPPALQSLAQFLGKSQLAEQLKTQESIRRFINSDLQPPPTTTLATIADPRLGLSAKALYSALYFAFSSSSQNSAETQATVTQLAKQILNFQSDFDDLRNQARHWEKRAGESEQTIQRLNTKLAETAELQTVLRERAAHLERIYQSTSWRMTRPLRFIGDALKVLKRIFGSTL